MKKTLVLVAMLLVQSLICLTFACDTIVSEQAPKSLVKVTSELSSPGQCTEAASSTEHQTHAECNQCNFCLHLVVTFLNVDIQFISNEISSQNFSAHEIYRQPFINQYKKPPIKA